MSSDSAAPDRTARQKCWDARDDFFRCLDKTANDDQAQCIKERMAFDGECAASWVDYFIKRRVLQKRQDAMMAASQVNSPSGDSNKKKV